MVEFTAGRFKASAHLEGYPLRAQLNVEHDGDLHSISHDEIKDLQYVLERMASAIRAALPGDKRHEMT